MKTIATLQADLRRSPLGTASRLATDLAGTSVLRRTVERLVRAERIDSVHVLVPAGQRDEAESLLDGAINGRVQVDSHDAGSPPWAELVRSARKWAIDGWRGGIGGTCWYDEQTHPALFAAIAQRENADAVVIVPAAAPLVDPTLLDAMIAHHASIAHEMRMTFTVAPPGLAGLVVRPDLLADLAEAGLPPSHLIRYQPDDPRGGYLNRPFCYQTPNAVAHTVCRLTADTHRATATLERLLAHHDDHADAERICRWLADHPAPLDALPREVEIELTTEDQLVGTTLRPRGRIVPGRGPIDLALVQRIVDALRQRDDSLLVLGGFGEPLLHPDFGRILEICRPHSDADRDGIFGLAVRTNGLALDRAAVERLAACRVDLLTVAIDAHTPQTYAEVNGADAFQTVTQNVEAALTFREETKTVHPLILPEFTKAKANVAEMEAFYDHWLRRAGAAAITGYSHHAGQCPDRAVMPMAPPRRLPCCRLPSRCMVLADGTVVACDQDFAAAHPLGNLHDESLTTVWTSPPATALRRAHESNQLDALPLCPHCDEWHRP